MKTAIIGAGKNKSGIGQYIGKYFQKNGAIVTSVLGTTEKTARKASSILTQYGIDAAYYTDFNRMMRRERPDAVVIASPALTHYEYLIKCVKEGVHIFCEKPFVWQDKNDIDINSLLENIFETAESNNLKIAMNSQCPFLLPYYEQLCGLVHSQKVDTFFIRLSPVVSGKEMILESVPHALSILYTVLGDGQIGNLSIQGYKEKIITTFHYIFTTGYCEVMIELVRTILPPRSFSYGFNNKIIHRVLDLDTYDIFFKYSDNILMIKDPLELSVQDFISAVRDKREPLIGKEHIMSNMTLLKKIYDYCET
ncbi:MAG: Gfo/Idh/MocA family oxidoreductase [Thermodesulfobacteriota bacterium]|nr:Gfo/Idh/MocA family oxidoreductase [Thermodesulfobacteriota bacterium]